MKSDGYPKNLDVFVVFNIRTYQSLSAANALIFNVLPLNFPRRMVISLRLA